MDWQLIVLLAPTAVLVVYAAIGGGDGSFRGIWRKQVRKSPIFPARGDL